MINLNFFINALNYTTAKDLLIIKRPFLLTKSPLAKSLKKHPPLAFFPNQHSVSFPTHKNYLILKIGYLKFLLKKVAKTATALSVGIGKVGVEVGIGVDVDVGKTESDRFITGLASL